MKLPILFAFLAAGTGVLAQSAPPVSPTPVTPVSPTPVTPVSPTPVPPVSPTPVTPVYDPSVSPTTVSTTVEFGPPLSPPIVPVPTGPMRVAPGTRLRLTLSPQAYAGATNVTWWKNGIQIIGAAEALDLGPATAEQSGGYQARFLLEGRAAATEHLSILVRLPVDLPLLALSVRGRIGPDQRMMIGGLAIGRSPSDPTGKRDHKTVLVRAIGPSLSRLGVAQPLTAPSLKIFHADGSPFTGGFGYVQAVGALTPEQHVSRATAAAGAFPLEPGTKDIAAVYPLPPGAYTIHVTSADAGTGDVLLEVYEVPDTW